jgi:predicted O-linked N-acetylglucosamine transferase (SPINDLY family)
LTHLGHKELLAETQDEYVQIAKELAKDATRLSKYRSGLRGALQSSPLGDAAGFARKVEDSYQQMWAQFASTAIIE